MKKASGDVIILHMCTINEKHMIYGSCDMKPNSQFFLILERFLPFYLSNNKKKSKFWKNEKTPGAIIILHICTIKKSYDYDSWDMEHDRQKFSNFGPFFALLLLNNPENQNFEKMKETPGDIITLNKCTKNYNNMMYGS